MKVASIGRNDVCHCMSGKKYKKCCLEKDLQAERETLEKASNAVTDETGEVREPVSAANKAPARANQWRRPKAKKW